MLSFPSEAFDEDPPARHRGAFYKKPSHSKGQHPTVDAGEIGIRGPLPVDIGITLTGDIVRRLEASFEGEESSTRTRELVKSMQEMSLRLFRQVPAMSAEIKALREGRSEQEIAGLVEKAMADAEAKIEDVMGRRDSKRQPDNKEGEK